MWKRLGHAYGNVRLPADYTITFTPRTVGRLLSYCEYYAKGVGYERADISVRTLNMHSLRAIDENSLVRTIQRFHRRQIMLLLRIILNASSMRRHRRCVGLERYGEYYVRAKHLSKKTSGVTRGGVEAEGGPVSYTHLTLPTNREV